MSTQMESLDKLNDAQFKQVTGVKRPTFKRMCEVLQADYNYVHQRRGRKSVLSIEDKVLITLKYLREYPSMLSLSVDFGVSEGTIRTVINHTEDVLVRCKDFKIPSRKKLLEPADDEISFLIVDATDTKIQRPKKNKKSTTQEKGNPTR